MLRRPLYFVTRSGSGLSVIVLRCPKVLLGISPGKVNFTEVDAADGAINDAVRHIGSRGSLCGTWNINGGWLEANSIPIGMSKFLFHFSEVS